MKILFCGTPAFAVPSLKALVEDSEFQVGLVLSQPDRPAGRGHKLQSSPIKMFAQSKNIPVMTPESASAPEVIQQLKQYQLDACVVVAYGQLLKPNFLELFGDRCVNLHGSLLPRWRGAAPLQRALMAGDKTSGVCLQVVVQKLDAGPVLGQRAISLSNDINAQQLHDQLSQLGVELLLGEFKDYLKNKIKPQQQDESQVTYAHKITKEETRIDWRESATTIHNKIRGLAMGPFAWSVCKGKKYKIHSTRVVQNDGPPGCLLTLNKEQMIVACGSQALSLQVIQPESKNKMAVGEFLRGTQLQQGDNFESN